ncbi:MAG TPA: RNA polymerase sigma factor [Candidatus Dormibacteraeota bacterium]|nr:RNA polymerase sigma factor [Candidatus Dormibacteraeota bacterium]
MADPLAASTEDAFEVAVVTEAQRLWALAFSILEDAAEAEDVVQETLERAWRRWSSLRDADRREAWLTRICVRRSIDFRRRLRSRHMLVLRAGSAVEPPPAPEDSATADLDRLYLTLSRHQRAVLVLHYHHGHSLDECARLMGCRPGTARSHLARALRSLREGLTDG